MVSFVNGSIHTPVVTSVYDLEHKESTRFEQTKHERKGVLIADIICNRQDWEIKDYDWDQIIGEDGETVSQMGWSESGSEV
jgi:hypothetical protein